MRCEPTWACPGWEAGGAVVARGPVAAVVGHGLVAGEAAHSAASSWDPEDRTVAVVGPDPTEVRAVLARSSWGVRTQREPLKSRATQVATACPLMMLLPWKPRCHGSDSDTHCTSICPKG